VARHTVITVPIVEGMITPVELGTWEESGNSLWKFEDYRVRFRLSPQVRYSPIRWPKYDNAA